MRNCSSTNVYPSPTCFSITICFRMRKRSKTMYTRLMKVVMASAGLLAMVLPVAAHHSFSAEFDQNKVVTLEGTVVQMDWVNPHSWLHIDVRKPDGSIERWKIEGGSPSVLLRKGWNRDSLPVGTKIKVIGYQAKDGSLRASSRDLLFPDGRRLDLSGSAPSDKDAPK